MGWVVPLKTKFCLDLTEVILTTLKKNAKTSLALTREHGRYGKIMEVFFHQPIW